MKIIREQSAQQRHHQSRERDQLRTGNPMLCGDCDALSYCQLARNLSHSQAVSFNSHRIINGALNLSAGGAILERQVMAERLKLRYKTCPFHRELSFG